MELNHGAKIIIKIEIGKHFLRKLFKKIEIIDLFYLFYIFLSLNA